MLRTHWQLIVFNLLYIAGFAVYYASIRDFEFLWYVLVLVFFFVLIGGTLSYTHFPKWLLWLLSFWGLLHMAGGGVPVGDDVLYGYQIVHLFGSGESFVLKFDQVVHFYGFFVATLAVWHLIKPHVTRPYATAVLLSAFFAGMGLGALNEVVEFIAVLAAPETGVGGYFNTALDLVFNTLGASAAAIALSFKGNKGKRLEVAG